VKALCCYSPAGEKSLGQPGEAAKSIQALLARYGDDLLAEYALLDLAKMQEVAQKDLSKAEATCRSFEGRYPRSTLAAKSVTEVARLLTAQGKYEEAILTYRRAIKQHPNSDEVMTATVGIGDAYRLSGEKEKARKQYQDARAMAQDWHDNKYGVDIGKQAWLRGILEHLRGQDAGR
jgi:TolA-binding protein